MRRHQLWPGRIRSSERRHNCQHLSGAARLRSEGKAPPASIARAVLMAMGRNLEAQSPRGTARVEGRGAGAQRDHRRVPLRGPSFEQPTDVGGQERGRVRTERLRAGLREGEVPDRARQAPGTWAGRHPRPRIGSGVCPLSNRHVHAIRAAGADPRRRRCGDRRWRDRRGARWSEPPAPRCRTDPDHRPGRRHRRNLVLEPVPGRDVRRGVIHLHAHARGARLRAHRAIRVRGGDPSPSRDDRRSFRSDRRCPVPHWRDSSSVGRDGVALAGRHGSPRRDSPPASTCWRSES